jgi:hypothetical protein
MAIDYESVADRIFDQLKGFGYNIIVYDADGRRTVNSYDGRYFYSTDQKFTIELNDDENVITVKYGASTDKDKMKKLLSTVRSGIAKKYLLGVDVMPYAGKDIELKNVEQMVKESLGPSTGSAKTSYQQTEGAKLIIRHNKPVNEEVRGSRSRNISALFIENAQGERFKYPHNHLLAARTMTQHVSKGGTPYDEVGQKIIGLSEERDQLLKVAGYIKGQGLQEQASDVQYAVTQRLSEIKSLLGKYNPERFMADIHEEDETNLDSLKEQLTKNIFDENIGNLLPKLNGYVKEYKAQMEAQKSLAQLTQQVEEATTIQVSAIPDLEMAAMMVYESPTVNTTELINMVLPVLEDESIKSTLAQVSEHVSEGRLDPVAVENIARAIVGKGQVTEETFESMSTPDQVFESVLSKYKLTEILK